MSDILGDWPLMDYDHDAILAWAVEHHEDFDWRGALTPKALRDKFLAVLTAMDRPYLIETVDDEPRPRPALDHRPSAAERRELEDKMFANMNVERDAKGVIISVSNKPREPDTKQQGD
jgi:hypothetical protein